MGLKATPVHKPLVNASHARVVPKRHSMKEAQGEIIAASSCSDRSHPSHSDAIDLAAVSGDLADSISTVCCHTRPVLLPAIAHCNQTCRITVPRHIVDAPRDDRKFASCTALAHAVPHAHCARNVARSHVEARRTEACDSGGVDVTGVLAAEAGMIKGAEKDGLLRGVGKALRFGVGGQWSWGASSGGRVGSEDEVYKWSGFEMGQVGKGKCSPSLMDIVTR